MTVCAAPNCSIPVNVEIGPMFCGPHWSMLGPLVKGAIHGEATREAGVALALTVIEHTESWQAKHPTGYCRRPVDEGVVIKATNA